MCKEKGMSTVVYSLVVDPDNKVRRVYNVESVLVWQDSILISYYLRGELETLSLPMSEVLLLDIV